MTFIPGTNDIALLEQAMRCSLAASIDYIFETVGERLAVVPEDVRQAAAAIRSHRVPPSLFGHYFQLVMAAQASDFISASVHLSNIVKTAKHTPGLTVGLFTEASLGENMRLFRELIDPDPGTSPWLCSPVAADGFEQRVRDSLALIAVADPALADELNGLVIQIVGAVPFSGSGARPFGSVSSFMLWGLLIVNMIRYRTAADLIQGLVHEAAHLLLFAHSTEEPMVTNAIEERYLSPLRPDPRPMDGVFHATFVSARIYHVNRKLREASTAAFQPVAMAELDDRLTLTRELYFGGLKTVRDHAKLTRTGQRILEETADYMQTS